MIHRVKTTGRRYIRGLDHAAEHLEPREAEAGMKLEAAGLLQLKILEVLLSIHME